MVLPHLFGKGEPDNEDFIDSYSFLQTLVKPEEHSQAIALIEKSSLWVYSKV